MKDLSTTYLGLTLKNPLIAASSPLTSSVEKAKRAVDAGVGAVILKSLFEEQISSDAAGMMDGIYTGIHTDAYDFLKGKTNQYYTNQYTDFIESAKKSLGVPVIASLNCVSTGTWTEFAHQIEAAGADALELNVFIVPASRDLSSARLEDTYVKILTDVKKKTSIPVSMKIGSHFTGLSAVIHRLCDAGADGLVLFNRFYRPDVDINALRLIPAGILSSQDESALPLQWIALMSGEIKKDLSASTGIWDGESVIKQLLAGARAVQLCSVLMKNGLDTVRTILSEVSEWMEKKGYSKISDFNGLLCQERSSDPSLYERAQYIKALTGIA